MLENLQGSNVYINDVCSNMDGFRYDCDINTKTSGISVLIQQVGEDLNGSKNLKEGDIEHQSLVMAGLDLGPWRRWFTTSGKTFRRVDWTLDL